MPLSYFDIGLRASDLPQASADALQAQETNHLAVAQAPSLRNALAQAAQRQQYQHSLALGDRRLALGETRLGLQQRELGLRQNAYDYTQGQLPYEIGLGAVSGGIRLASGFGALNDQARTKAFQDQQLLEGQRQARLSTANTMSLVDAYAKLRQGYADRQYPLPITSTPLPTP